MSNQGVIRGTRRRSTSESGHPRLNSTIIDNDLVFDENDWQASIEYDLITFDSINTEHCVLKGNTHSLNQEALYAPVSEKFSHGIIGLVSLIDRVKRAAHRYIRNEEHIAETESCK